MPDAQKEQVVQEICDTIGVPFIPLGPGSKEKIQVFEQVAERCNLHLGRRTKHQYVEEIITRAGLPMLDQYISTGQTVTLEGLQAIADAARILTHTAPAAPTPDPPHGRPFVSKEGGVDAPDAVLVSSWDAMDKATRAHAELESGLAEFVEAAGHQARSPASGEPQYDVGWRPAGHFVVAEVKSVTPVNHRQQVRLGLGQVIEYREQFRSVGEVGCRAVLAIAAVPDDLDRAMCASVDVTITHRPFDELPAAGLV